MRIALGSSRAAKVAALRSAAACVASIEAQWGDAAIIACDVETDTPAMPLTDEDLMRGARARALAVQALVLKDRGSADLYVGLEGGFHSTEVEGKRLTFLKGWAYVTDGSRGSFGASPSIIVPEVLVHGVVDGGRELAEVIDETAGEHDVRSRQGAWGVLSRDLFTRAMSFEVALVAAFAPFYNAQMYAR
ncbi:MAG TPA: inosine/xanthosine triphosphatase [Blastocatellia bacterium]|nr:inosine/xanthosine triphosphatase [Blastocatellia bacterium]